MGNQNAGQAQATSTVEQEFAKMQIAIDPSKFQFADLRIGTLNCHSQNAEKRDSILEYCEKSGCDIVALQETGTIFDGYENARIKKFAKEALKIALREEDRGMAFFIKDPKKFTSLIKGKHVHPRIVILRFTYKDVKFTLLNVYGVVPDSSQGSVKKANELFKDLQNKTTIETKEENKIVIGCGDMNAFPIFASFGIYSPWIKNHAYGSYNTHGESFFRFLESAQMKHLNSRFKKPKDRKWTRRGYGDQGNTEIDGFLCERSDIVQDVDSFIGAVQVSDHRLIGSLWRVSKEYEEFRRNASRDDLKKCNIFQPLHWVSADSPNFLDHLNELFSDPEFAVDEYRKKLSNSQKLLKDSQKSLCLTIDEVRKHFPKSTAVIRIQSALKQFNDALNNFNVPSEWKEIYFVLPKQSVFAEKVGYYDFPWRRRSLRRIYSNILAQKSNSSLGKYIHGDQWYYDANSEDMETQGKQKAIENILILVLLLLKYKNANEPLYFLFIKFENAQSSVKISSVLASLKKAKVPPQLFFAFASLLIGSRVVLKTSKGSLKSDKNKLRGLHLGNLANSLLLSVVIKTIRDECDRQYAGITIGGKSLKSIQFDDQIVLIDGEVSNFENHLSGLLDISTSHGLVFDKNDLTLIKNTANKGVTNFMFQGTKIKTATKTKNRVVSYLGRAISVNSTVKYDIKQRVVQIKELIRSDSSLISKSDPEKESFFNNTIVPKIFKACETWSPSSKEIKTISDYLQYFWKVQLSIETTFQEYNVFRKILSEKARFIKWLASKRNSFCYKLLNEETRVVPRSTSPPGRAIERPRVAPNADWTFELVKSFNKFKENRSLQLSIEVNGHTLLEIASDTRLWNEFLKYCETEAAP